MSSVRADGSVDFNKFHKEQNRTNKFSLSNGKTGFQTIHDGLDGMSDSDKTPTLKYLQVEGKASYFLGKDANKVNDNRQKGKQILGKISPDGQKHIKNMTQNMSAADINLLGQSANKKLFEVKQNTLSNGQTASQYLKKTLAPLSDKGQVYAAKYLRDESRATFFHGKGNQQEESFYQNNAQHQLNNLSPNDTEKLPSKLLAGEDLSKVGQRANNYVHHRQNGWKQAQFFYQAKGRENYFKTQQQNPKKASLYQKQAQNELNNMTPDTKKRTVNTYNNSNLSILSKKANRWINYNYGQHRQTGYNRNSNKRRYSKQNRNAYKNNNYNRNTKRNRFVSGLSRNDYSRKGFSYRNNNHTRNQKDMLNSVMGNKNYQHTQHHDITKGSNKVSVTRHSKQQPKRSQELNKEASFQKKQGGITPSDMPF